VAALGSLLECALPGRPARAHEASSGRSEWRTGAGIFVVCTGVLALRAPAAFTKIFADDGSEFIGRAARGLSLRTTFAEYRGYLSVVPRLIAATVVQLPTAWWAAGLAAAAVAISAGTAVLTYAGARCFVPQRSLCSLLAISVAFVPALRSESIDNVANLQFVLPFAAFWIFLLPPRGGAPAVARVSAIVLIGLSAPLVFVLLPLPIARVLRFGRNEMALLAATVGTLITQVSVRVFAATSTRGGDAKSVGNAAAAYGRQVIEATFGGFHVDGGRVYEAGLGAVVALAGAAIGIAWVRRAATMPVEDARVLCLRRLEFLVATSLVVSGVMMIVAVQLGGTGSYRYAVAPSLFLCTFIAAAGSRTWIALTDSTRLRAQVRSRRVVLASLAAACALVAIGWIHGFNASTYRRSGPTWASSLAVARSTCRSSKHDHDVKVAIAPQVSTHGSWAIDLRCASL
jgi:hypothetical protein